MYSGYVLLVKMHAETSMKDLPALNFTFLSFVHLVNTFIVCSFTMRFTDIKEVIAHTFVSEQKSRPEH